THLAQPQTGGPPGVVRPAVRHLTRAADRERRRRLAAHAETARTRARGRDRIEPDGGDQDQVGHEHRVDTPRDPQRGEAEESQAGPHPERRPRAENHVVGTSVLSRMAWSAASGAARSRSSPAASVTWLTP